MIRKSGFSHIQPKERSSDTKIEVSQEEVKTPRIKEELPRRRTSAILTKELEAKYGIRFVEDYSEDEDQVLYNDKEMEEHQKTSGEDYALQTEPNITKRTKQITKRSEKELDSEMELKIPHITLPEEVRETDLFSSSSVGFFQFNKENPIIKQIQSSARLRRTLMRVQSDCVPMKAEKINKNK